MARITGPGTVPLYVQAGKKTPGAISSSSSRATSVYSRTRPGLCGSAGGGYSSASRSFGPPTAGAPSPIIAACPIAALPACEAVLRCAPWSWPAASASPPSTSLAPSGAAASGAVAQRSRRRVSLGMPKLYWRSLAMSKTGSGRAEAQKPERAPAEPERGPAAAPWDVASARSSLGFVMNPISTRITGTSAQLKPVKSERSWMPRSGNPSARTSSAWTSVAARRLER